MSVVRRDEFKVYPSATQRRLLEDWTALHARLFNACLEQRISAYRSQANRQSVGYYQQQNELPALKAAFPEFVPLGSHALQETVRRVERAFRAFFRRVKAGETPGFPRFKSAKRYRGFTYPDPAGWKFEPRSNGKHGKLSIGNLGALKVRGQPRQWGKASTLTLTRKADGEWYASITVNCSPAREAGVHAVGMDLGCEYALSLSDGATVENPRYLRQSLERMKVLSRAVLRKKRGGKNRGKAGLKLARLHRRIANQRRNFHHQESARLVASYGLIATETLSVKKMTASGGAYKTGLNRSILDVGMASFLQHLRVKVEETGHGRLVEARTARKVLFCEQEVPTRKVKPSQTCPMCGAQHKKPLSERVHSCLCGYSGPRDVVAAQVMLAWAMGTLPEPKSSSTRLESSGLASRAGVAVLTQETAPRAPKALGAQ